MVATLSNELQSVARKSVGKCSLDLDVTSLLR